MKTYLLVNIAILLLVILILTGCMSYTTLQSPKTLEPGKVLIGAGASAFTDGDFKPVFEVNSRVGVISNFDIGAKLVGGPLIFLDAKYQIIQSPIYLSADLGWSYFSYSGTIGDEVGRTTCWYPMIIAGQDNWYVGIKKVHMSIQSEGEFKLTGSWKFNGSGWISTNIVAGGIIGEKIRFIPEINLVIPDHGGKSLIVPALGLQFVL